MLARQLLSKDEYKHRALWLLVWLPIFFLVSFDPNFNLFNHTLHNDGLALLVSISAFWLIVRHSLKQSSWLLVLMAALPAVGFLVKQNQLMWLGVFAIYLLVSGHASRRQFLLFLFGSVGSIIGIVALGYALWGQSNYIWWIFQALSQKEVSLPRSLLHLLDAGVYAVMGILGAWILVLRNLSRLPGCPYFSSSHSTPISICSTIPFTTMV